MGIKKVNATEERRKSLLEALVKLYKAMVTSGDKYWIHQKTLSDGIILVEWCKSNDDSEADFVYLSPTDYYDQVTLPYYHSLINWSLLK